MQALPLMETQTLTKAKCTFKAREIFTLLADGIYIELDQIHTPIQSLRLQHGLFIWSTVL